MRGGMATSAPPSRPCGGASPSPPSVSGGKSGHRRQRGRGSGSGHVDLATSEGILLWAHGSGSSTLGEDGSISWDTSGMRGDDMLDGGGSWWCKGGWCVSRWHRGVDPGTEFGGLFKKNRTIVYIGGHLCLPPLID